MKNKDKPTLQSCVSGHLHKHIFGQLFARRAKEKQTVLRACLGKEQELTELVEYAADSIVSKTILDKSVGTITLFAFDKGQRLSEHQTPFDAVARLPMEVGIFRLEIHTYSHSKYILLPAGRRKNGCQ